MPGRVIGDVFVVVNPDATGFRQIADVQIRKQLAGFRPNVLLGVDAKEANIALAGLQARIKAMSGRLTQLRLGADGKKAESEITRLQARLATLAKQMAHLTMGSDTTKIDAAIKTLEARAAHLREDLRNMPAGVDAKAAKAQLAAMYADVRRLKQEAADIRLGANIDMGKLLAAEAALLGIEHTVGELGKKTAPAANTAMSVFFASTSRGATAAAAGWRLLTGHITLFGGALNRVLPRMFTSVAVWHLLADAVIETVAVWTPAIIAVTAFGVAGADAARMVYNRMAAVHTVMDATGQAVPPLSRNFEKLAIAVRPEVYQLFGDALVIMNKRGGAFNTIAIQTGKVLDQLAARFVAAVTTGTGVNKFLENAVNDVRLLGDSIGNFGGIFGAVFRAVPGYAEILLKVGDWMTKVLEAFTQAAEPVIAFGLALHGFFIYGGTAVTLFLAMVGGLVKLTGAFFNFNKAVTLVGLTSLKTFAVAIAGGIANIITYTGVMLGMAASEGVAAAATALLSDAMLVLSRVPVMVWITLAAGAIAGLVFAFRDAHTATSDFVNGLQKSIQNAQLPNLLDTIGHAQSEVAARLIEAQVKLAHTQEYSNFVNLHTGETSRRVTDAYREQAGVVDALQAAHSQLGQQFQMVSGRIGKLAKEYGGTTQALGALNLAGVTTSQVLDKNNANWQVALVQVAAATAAYEAMGVQAGQLGNDLDVLGRTETDQYTATQKLNQAWTAFISDVTSTQGSFDTVAQGFATLNDHTGTLKLSLGKLKVAYKDNKAAIDSLTPSGIALNQAFTDQVRNIDALFASWRTAGLANNLFTAGVRAAIAPMTKYARGSQEATAQLVALAQEAGYQGPVSMAALTKWLGNTHNATQRLKDITNQATIQEALLTGAMQAQGSYIANTLIRDINNAILKYNGVEKAAADYGNAVARSGQQSDAARSARQRLITDIIKSGQAAGDSKQQIAAMISKVLGIPPKVALQIVMDGIGRYTISQAAVAHARAQGPGPFAAGGYIDMGSGPTADDVPILASRGEYVVNAASTARYRPVVEAINAGTYALGGPVRKFAAGGLVPHVSNAVFGGDTSVLTGQYAVNSSKRFGRTMLNAEISAMISALNKAEQAAAQAFSVSGAGPVGGDAAANKALARSMFPWPASMWPSYDYLEMREAGYNRFAENPSSGAYGIPQALPPTKMPFAAQKAGGSHAGPQISWMYSYIRSVYGNPVNAAAHERSANWYKHGGLVGMAQKLAAGGIVGMAAGGPIPLARYLPQLKFAQGHEYHDYLGLRKAYLTDLARARKGSWTSGHKAGIRSELATLARYQSLEEAAYDNILHHGTARANLSKFASRIRSVARTSRDKDLSHSHPGWSHGLQYWLGVLTHLAQAGVAPPYGGSQAKLLFPDWITRLKRAQAHERFDETGLQDAFRTGLAHARRGTWLYSHRTALRNELSLLARRQADEQAAYAALVAHSSGSLADLNALGGRISGLGARVGAVTAASGNKDLVHLPGGHPGWVKALREQLRILAGLTASQPFFPPWNPGNLGPSHTAAGGVLQFRRGGPIPVRSFDGGGYLPPRSLTLAWNGKSTPEPVGGGGGDIHIHLHNEGVIGSAHEMQDWLHQGIREITRIRGGGNVQVAFGRNHPP